MKLKIKIAVFHQLYYYFTYQYAGAMPMNALHLTCPKTP
jgi:hypothetical protein